MRAIFAAVLCAAAIIGHFNAASAQYYASGGYYYYPSGGYYNYGSPAGVYNGQPLQELGWNYTRNQPEGYGRPYPAARMPDGTLACEHSNYRPIRGWCQRVCCDRPDSP